MRCVRQDAPDQVQPHGAAAPPAPHDALAPGDPALSQATVLLLTLGVPRAEVPDVLRILIAPPEPLPSPLTSTPDTPPQQQQQLEGPTPAAEPALTPRLSVEQLKSASPGPKRPTWGAGGSDSVPMYSNVLEEWVSRAVGARPAPLLDLSDWGLGGGAGAAGGGGGGGPRREGPQPGDGSDGDGGRGFSAVQLEALLRWLRVALGAVVVLGPTAALLQVRLHHLGRLCGA